MGERAPKAFPTNICGGGHERESNTIQIQIIFTQGLAEEPTFTLKESIRCAVVFMWSYICEFIIWFCLSNQPLKFFHRMDLMLGF